LEIVQSIWAPLRKLFAPPGVPGWLRAWYGVTQCSLRHGWHCGWNDAR